MDLAVKPQPRAELAVLYEHPQWFQPLFAAFDRRGVRYEPVQVSGHRFDPAERGRLDCFPAQVIAPMRAETPELVPAK